jgi:ribonucleoside-diphosphate reductase alpha chain
MTISDSMQTYSVRVETPDGTLFVHIIEDDEGNPVEVRLNIGKAGGPLQAWSSCAALLISLGLQKAANIYDMLETLCDIKADKLTVSSGIPIYSGPDGLVQAFLTYLKEKEHEKYGTGQTKERRGFIKRLEADS